MKYIQSTKTEMRKLIEEVLDISKILNNNDINHSFLKGSSNIFSKIYTSNAERMVGDIDILVEKNKINEAFKILTKEGYRKSSKFNFLNETSRHLPRLISKNKLFAVELHRRITDKDIYKNIKSEKILTKSIRVGGVMIPSEFDQLLVNIYNYQINDNGHIFHNLSIRNYYDTKLILNKIKMNLDFSKDSLVNDYFELVKKEFKLKNPKVNTSSNKLYLIRYCTKKNLKLYRLIDNFVGLQLKKIYLRPKQFKLIFSEKIM